MKAKPILFSTPMVQAILAGKKTQTRRVVKVNPALRKAFFEDKNASEACVYGQIGDLLWVRETFVPLGFAWKVAYKADGKITNTKWKPSIFMPRWASRITLQLSKVRVERLQDISVEDCIAEGLSTTLRENEACADLQEQYQALWEKLNGKESWAENPWVWVLEFTVHRKTIEDMKP